MEVDRCEDLRPHFPRFVVGLAEAHIMRRIELHRGEGCSRCAAAIDRLEHAFHAVPLALPVEPLPEGSIDFIVGSVGRTPQEHVEVPILFPDPDPVRLWRLLCLLSAVALFCAALWGRGVQSDVADVERAAAADRAQIRRVLDDYRAQRGELEALQGLTRTVTNPALPLGDLRAGDARLRAWADGEALMTTVVGVPAGDGALVLWWAADDGAPVALGELEGPMAQRGGAKQFPLPAGATAPAVLILSREAAPGWTAPGELVLTGPIR